MLWQDHWRDERERGTLGMHGERPPPLTVPVPPNFCAPLPSSHTHSQVQRMKNQPGAAKPMGFVSPPSNYIDIASIRLLRGPESAAALASTGL